MENMLDSGYYRTTRWALKLMGQWPFQSPRRNKFFKCITLSLITSICIPTMTKFVESLKDIDIVMECVPMIGVYGTAYLKYFTWVFHHDRMKGLLLSIERDWKNLKIERDIELLGEYSERARRMNNLYTSTE
ncbi:uncharacterized protein [Fopius arisanus]|uniref:Uncharacterized protein isoform X1 n=1 Tax=Fopius arisanus TaxID=64838 RepID=A0A9R1TZE1_9HYME|nr:PREDICTED: uncharacterized protein LOC105265697 isoform X1 [Fopius arisanus]